MTIDNSIETTEEVAVSEKRGRGRPRKERPEEVKVMAKRPERVPLGGFRNILTLQNTDPNYHYSMPVDVSENGAQIARFLAAGYEFVRPEEKVMVGEHSVFKTEGFGSVSRVPTGGGSYHYLMKIPQEWFEEDMARHNERVDMTEGSLRNQGKNTAGFYGDVSIN